MGRDHHHGGKRHFHKNQHHGKNKNFKQNNKNANWQTDKRIHEDEVGITEFINTESKGFHGIIKCR